MRQDNTDAMIRIPEPPKELVAEKPDSRKRRRLKGVKKSDEHTRDVPREVRAEEPGGRTAL